MRLARSIAAAGVAGALLLSGATTALATADAGPNRLAGPDRYATARAIAQATYTSATAAIIASGQSYPDALAASYLSGVENAPLLLTEQGRLTPGVVDTLRALQVNAVTIVGGSTAVSGQVAVDLERAGFPSERIAGVDRYETARKIAELLPADTIGKFGAGRAAIVATGTNFADALAAGPMAGSQGMPIVLTPGDTLHEQARAALSGTGIQQVLIVGGTAAVSDSVAAAITGMGIAVRRIAGENRQATAVAIAEVEKGELNYPISRVQVARGNDFADALAGGSRGARVFAPVLLTNDQNNLGAASRAFISANNGTIGTVDILGGTAAVATAVENDAVAAARGQ